MPGENAPERVPGWAMFSATQLMGFLFAFAVVWPLVRVTGAAVAFVLAWVGASLYFLRKRSPVDVLGSGLYAAAGGVAVTPIEVYAPTLFGTVGEGGATGATVAVESARGLLTWVVVCGFLAVSMVAVGRYCKRVADRREIDEFRLRRWYDQRR